MWSRQYKAGSGVGESGRAAKYPRIAAVAFMALAMGGCSFTLPMMGLSWMEDEPAAARTTASVVTPKAIPGLSKELGPEDQRRALGAMALALDPQGNGAPVAWSNSESGLKGHFTPVGGPFLQSDEICRSFITLNVMQTGPDWRQGTACRPSGGEWSIKDLKAFRKP